MRDPTSKDEREKDIFEASGNEKILHKFPSIQKQPGLFTGENPLLSMPKKKKKVVPNEKEEPSRQEVLGSNSSIISIFQARKLPIMEITPPSTIPFNENPPNKLREKEIVRSNIATLESQLQRLNSVQVLFLSLEWSFETLI